MPSESKQVDRQARRPGTVVVVADGPRPFEPQLAWEGDVIAADGGVDRALELGLPVDVAVGDFDSVSPAGLAAAEASGARVVRHPREKELTDLELALDEAAAREPTRVVVVGSAGGRLDHLLGALLILGSDRYRDFELDARFGAATIHVVRSQRELVGEPGELVSLLALHGAAERVETDGLRYPLRGERLLPGSGHGVSNVFTARQARISLEAGVVVAVRPGRTCASS